jgi:hypothetical protein
MQHEGEMCLIELVKKLLQFSKRILLSVYPLAVMLESQPIRETFSLAGCFFMV